jgi:hypothetical protein
MAALSDIKKAKMAGLLKKELSNYDRDSRSQILYNSMNWIQTQRGVDRRANDAYMWFQLAYQVSQNSSAREFLTHYFWDTFGNNWDSPSFKAAIASILDDAVFSEEEDEESDSEEEDEDDEESESDSEEDEAPPKKTYNYSR